MRIPRTRNSGQCIFCAFQASPESWPIQRNARPFASSSFKPLYSRKGQQSLREVVGFRAVNKYWGHRSFVMPSFSDTPPTSIVTMQRRNRAKNPDDSEHDGRAYSKRLKVSGSKTVTTQSIRKLVMSRLAELRPELRNTSVLDKPEISEEDARNIISNYEKHIWDRLSPFRPKNDLIQPLREIYFDRGDRGLDSHLKHMFYRFMLDKVFSAADVQNQKLLADLRYPAEWFPRAHLHPRTIHVHIGPTNSGKTYHALNRLVEAKSGVYAGPLRLLAHEVFTNLSNKGIACSLLTGEEQRQPSNFAFAERTAISCTVEMCPLHMPLEVAVIDEIQMLGSKDRGWAWTSALMGVRAKEIHVCGEERALPLVKEIALSMGDELVIHRYKRLTPLETEPHSLQGDFRKLRKGDCVVTFSVVAIHALRQQIERLTGKRVAIVYGSLPPETRAQQARLFNDPDNDYDYLVASDAIGMGLNLSIKRVIFETVRKFTEAKTVTLTNSEIRQIAGRAGRYRSAKYAVKEKSAAEIDKDNASTTSNDKVTQVPRPPDATPPRMDTPKCGWVTTLEEQDLPVVVKAMRGGEDTLNTAGISPPVSLVQRFNSYFPPGTPFSYILIRLNEISQLNARYHLCGLKDQVLIADLIHSIKGLTIDDRLVLCNAPCALRFDGVKPMMTEMANCVADQRGGNILELRSLKLELLDEEVQGQRLNLLRLETLHKGVILYLWLSYRFPGVFTTRPLATHIKELIETNIERTLQLMSFSEVSRKDQRERQRWKALRDEMRKNLLFKADEAETGLMSGHEMPNVETSSAESANDASLEQLENVPGQAGEMTLDEQTSSKAHIANDERGEHREEEIEEEQLDGENESGFKPVYEEKSAGETLSEIDDDLKAFEEIQTPEDEDTEQSSEFSPSPSTSDWLDPAEAGFVPASKNEAPNTKVSNSETIETNQVSKSPLTAPFTSQQPNSSDELAKLIAQQQQSLRLRSLGSRS